MDSITTIQGRGDELIDVAGIERELAAMWRSASAEPGHGTVTRACRTNLVVLDGVAPELLEEITRRHPARLITATSPTTAGGGEATGTTPLSAHVSALCHLRPGGGGLLCSERIAFIVPPGAEARLASAIRALLVGDQPVAILGSPDALIRFGPTGLFRIADRVLVDSTGFPAGVWGGLVDAIGGAERLVDLAWLRLRGFRRAVAQTIVRSPMRKAVHRLEALDIGHAGRPSAAILVAAWLGHRLRWGRPRRPRVSASDGAGTSAVGPAANGGAGGGGRENGLRLLEVSGRGRRLRLRFGESQPPEDIVLLARTPDIELRAALNERDSLVHVVFGAGRARLRRDARQGARSGGSPPRRERIPITVPSLAGLVVEALEHRGICDRDAQPVFARARDMAQALASLSAMVPPPAAAGAAPAAAMPTAEEPTATPDTGGPGSGPDSEPSSRA